MSKGPQLTFREGLALIVAFVVAFGALAVTSAGADVQTEVCDKTGIFIKEDLKSDGYEVGDVIVLNDESNPPGLSMEATITSIKDDGEPLTIEYGDPPEGYEIDSTCEKVGKNENAAISHVVVYLTEVTETETPSPTPTSTPSPTSTGTPSPTPTESPTITPTPPTPTETETPSQTETHTEDESPTPSDEPSTTEAPSSTPSTPSSTPSTPTGTPSPTPTESPATTPAPTASPSTEPPSTTSTTPSTTPNASGTSWTPPSDSSTQQDELPRTGNNTGILLIGMLGLFVLGGVSWGARRWMLR